MLVAEGLTKYFGSRVAVDDVSMHLKPGTVTGFLGPNGAGKSTTMRMLIGLDRPDSGTVRVNGRQFAQLRAPLTEVGTLLDASGVNPRRSAQAHLRMLAATNGINSKRVEEVMELTGVARAAHLRVGSFSLGMRQRLGVAGSLLGDPHTVLLDEPLNGLDPEGVLWLRSFVRSLAAEGRAVLLSSHLMSEVAQVADNIMVLGRGRVLTNAPLTEFLESERTYVRVRVSEPETFARILRNAGCVALVVENGTIEVEGLSGAQIFRAAAGADIDLHELTPNIASLEDAYLSITDQAVEYRTVTRRATA